jgi:serine/threonine protein kinase
VGGIIVVDLVGKTMGQYQIVERLGRGGMADVYKAFHPGLAVHRALKVIRPEFVSEAGFKERFQREAQAVAALRQPNIVQMHDFGVQDNLYYMVMEFIDGQDLKMLLAKRGPIRPFNEIEDIIEQVGLALSYAHQQGVVHRDIKPANIMRNAEGQIILTDFGIAKMVSMEEQMTQTGVGIGTPAYMAPEQARGQTNVGPSADIYSLGIVLYEMLTGQVPFSADTPLAVMMKVVNDPIPPPRDFSPDIPDVLQGVILKATAKEPAQRYQTAEALVDALKRSLDAGSDPTPPDVATQVSPTAAPKPGRRRIPWLAGGAVLAVLLCLLLAAAGSWLFWPPSEEASLATWLFVIDSSEAMRETVDGRTKVEIAEAALAEELDILPSNVKAGLRIFGGGRTGQTDCDDTALLVEPAAGQHDELANAFAEVTPGGEAPLTTAIVQATGDFGPNDIAQAPLIIIITAGLDTCEENAVAQLERLSSRLDFEYELHLIGLGVAAETDQEQLRQIAEAAGGAYHDAENQEDIGRVLQDEIAIAVESTPEVQPTDPEITVKEEGDLQIGDTVSGRVDRAIEQDMYTFAGAENDQIVIRMANMGDELQPEAQIYGPDDEQLCSNWQYAGQTLEMLCQLEDAGTHTILAGGHESSGSYNLSFQQLN